MKILLLLSAIIGVAYCGTVSPALANDLKDFIVAMPIKDFKRIATDHLANDEEFKAAVKYVQSADFKTMVANLNRRPSVKEVRTIITEAGLDVEFLESMLYAYLDSLRIDVSPSQKRSFAKFIKDIDRVMPYDKLYDMLEDKLENSPAFKKFFDTISSDRMHQLADKIIQSEDFHVLAKELLAMDVPVYKFVEVVYSLMGWKNDDAVPNDLE